MSINLNAIYQEALNTGKDPVIRPPVNENADPLTKVQRKAEDFILQKFSDMVTKWVKGEVYTEFSQAYIETLPKAEPLPPSVLRSLPNN